MSKRIARIIIAIFGILIGLYPLMYLLSGERINLLQGKPDELYFSSLWQAGFHFHIIFGGIALLIGWIQFFPRIRNRYLRFHRIIGRIYVVAVMLGGIAGIYLALNANGGIIAKTGFFLLGIGWTSTTLFGLGTVRKGMIDRHQSFMIFSYALCFAAVTLRIWLPLLQAYFGEFLPAYRIVAWLCWVPNLLVAWWIVSRKERQHLVSTH